MNNHMYWISALLFAVLLSIILISDYLSNDSPNKTEKRFRLLIHWVIVFCYGDTLWGLCSCGVIKNDLFFFIISEFYHLFAVITTYFWLTYILSFLGDRIKHRKLYISFNFIVIFIETIFVILNIFKPLLFRIEDGEYVTFALRPITFFSQYIAYLLIGIITLICAFKEKNRHKNKFFTVFIFCLAPIILGIFQLLYPKGPFYSMGYFVACFVVHMFIVIKDSNSLSRNKVLNSLADIYYSMHYFNLEKNTVEIILEPIELSNNIINVTDPQEMLNKTMKATVCEEYLEMVLKFVDLSTISDRLKDKNHIWCEFIGRNFGWVRIRFITVEEDDGLVKKFVLTSQIIDEEKKAEINLLFQSNNDELTGLYNRRSYEKELTAIKESGELDNLVCISMDLNGLKTANDTMGHEAGDELIKGAADCIKKCFGLYGKVFRTGGDEFCALIYTPLEKLEQIKSDFNDIMQNWSGNLVKNLSISCGYVSKEDLENPTLHDMTVLADKRMYEAKSEYYKNNGLERRKS